MKKYLILRAFSLVEMLITLVVVSVLLSAFVPVITKKMTKNIDITAGGSSVPIGTIVMWLGKNPPDGWLVCNGQEYSNTTYPKLAEFLGKDKNNKYTVPNMKGYVPIGATDDDIDDANDGNSFYNK